MADPAALSNALLAWYDRHRRTLPWRAARGEAAEPYRIWVSEIMLQQTTVATVAGYFARFVARFPTLESLAAASLDDVLRAWQGLGYYARARNLHACARTLMQRHRGRFPETEADLAQLPGIGAYTAAAIAAIAFDRPAAAVDGNAERVLARLHAIEAPLPAVKPRLRAEARSLVPAHRAGDFAQAMMDLGAGLCTPREPQCAICPWQADCRARALGIAEGLPRRRRRPQRPTRRGVAFWIVRSDGAVLLRRRAERGLLGGMMEVPSTEWRKARTSAAEARRMAPIQATKWIKLSGVVRHTFTHFHLELEVLSGEATAGADPGGRWIALDRLGEQALPTVMKKVVKHALAAAAARGRSAA